MKTSFTLSRILIMFIIVLLPVSALMILLRPQTAGAGIFEATSETVYKEVWINHSQFTGGCEDPDGDGIFTHSKPGGTWYAEPLGKNTCPKLMGFTLPTLTGVTKAEIYLDLWRNRDDHSMRFELNSSGVVHQPNVGTEFGRTPYVGNIPLSELQSGSNVLTIWKQGSQYHLHDAAIRLYYASSSTIAPDGQLVQVEANNGVKDPAAGGILDIDGDQVTLTATVDLDTRYVEFHAFYEGYDEDNDGDSQDWHNLGRNNWFPGGRYGTEPPPLADSGTINHIGTVAVGANPNIAIQWNIPHIPGQSGVRFKIRLIDTDGNVRDAAGGQSAAFTLRRTKPVIVFTNPDFAAFGLGFCEITSDPSTCSEPLAQSTQINIPVNPNDFDQAFLLGSFWKNPKISVNSNPIFTAFASEDVWTVSNRTFGVNQLNQGNNSIEYSYNGGFGQMVEPPGPMIVLKATSANGVDNAPPIAHGHNPAANVSFVAANTNVSINLVDIGVGIDLNTVTMTVAGQVVNPSVVGDKFQYQLVYNPSSNFAPGQTVNVRLEACDNNGNCMNDEVYAFTITPPNNPSTMVSEDFNICTLADSSANWEYINPLSDATLTVTDNVLKISVPSGTGHNLDEGNDTAPRIMQSVNDAPNFVMEAKFESPVSVSTQMQGVIIEKNSNNFIRVNFQPKNDSVRIIGTVIENGTAWFPLAASKVTSINAASSDPLYLRIERALNIWTIYYSTNGVDWLIADSFDHTMTVNKVGLFAGNAGNNPAHTAVIDYFFNNSVTIDPEDGVSLFLPVDVNDVTVGMVSKDSDCGNPVTLTATPFNSLDYEFDHWSGSTVDGNTNSPVVVNYAKGDTVTAYFSRIEYSVITDIKSIDHEGNELVDPTGGSVSKSDPFPHYYGESVTLTAVPTPGWSFTGWEGGSLDGETDSVETIIISQNEDVTAVFTQDKYTITELAPVGEGTYTVDYPTNARSYLLYGETILLTATPNNSDWHFVRWGGDLSGNNNPKTLAVTSDLDITAIFSDEYVIYIPFTIKP